MNEQTKSNVIAVIAGIACAAIFISLLIALRKIIPFTIFVGIIISCLISTILILLHLYKSEIYSGWKKILLYSIPVVIPFLSIGINEIIEHNIRQFTDKEFGILVANFEGETYDTKRQGMKIKNAIVYSLKNKFYKSKFEIKKLETNVRIEPLNEAITPKTRKVKILGKKYNATIILYGRITGSKKNKAQIFPWITIVDTVIAKEIHKIDICMGKYTLDWKKIELPSAIIENPKTVYILNEALKNQSKKDFDKAEEKIKSISGLINQQDTLSIKHHFLASLYLSKAIEMRFNDDKRDTLLYLAKLEYENSILNDSTYHNSYFGLGYLLAELKKKPDLAVPYFEKARELQKENYKYNWNLVQAYLQTKQFEKANEIISTSFRENSEIQRRQKRIKM